MKKLIVVLAFLPFIGAAALQPTCNSTEACITLAAPKYFVNQQPIPAGTPITYTVYRGELGKSKRSIYTLTSTFTKLTQQPSGMQCYQITATIEGAESALSNEECKLIRPPAPTDGAIEDVVSYLYRSIFNGFD